MNKKIVGFVLIIVLAIAVGLIFKSSQKTVFSFVNNDTNEELDGLIYLDGKYLASTKEGPVKVSNLDGDYPKIVRLVDEKESEPFELRYILNENYSDYSTFFFETRDDEIEAGKRYYKDARNDLFKETKENHWAHMPLTYSYADNCYDEDLYEIKKKVESALDYITQQTSKKITFSYPDSKYSDITFSCKFNDDLIISLVGPNGESAHAIPQIYPETNIYSEGVINVYEKDSCPLGQRQVVIIHEVLHLFGLKHNKEGTAGDIMGSTFSKGNCNKEVSDKDRDYLIGIYSGE